MDLGSCQAEQQMLIIFPVFLYAKMLDHLCIHGQHMGVRPFACLANHLSLMRACLAGVVEISHCLYPELLAVIADILHNFCHIFNESLTVAHPAKTVDT